MTCNAHITLPCMFILRSHLDIQLKFMNSLYSKTMYFTKTTMSLKRRHKKIDITQALYYSLVTDSRNFGQRKDYLTLQKVQEPISMAIGNVELVQECFHHHSLLGTARMKQNKPT